MSYPKRLTADLPSMNRQEPQKKSFVRRIFPIIFILCAGILGFLIPNFQRSESTASNNPPANQEQPQVEPEPVYENKTYALVKSNDLGYLNVRAEASTSSTKLGQLKIGDKVELISAKDTWVQVKLDPPLGGKDSGWVAAEYVDQITEKIRIN